MKPTWHVTVLIETSREYGRGLLRGISHFYREHPHWSIYFEQQDLGAPLPRWLSSWEGDGILARVTNLKMARTLFEKGLPMIDLRGGTLELGLPPFGPDNRAISIQAFEHLAACGLEHFAFVGEPTGKHVYDDERRAAFQQIVREHGKQRRFYMRYFGIFIALCCLFPWVAVVVADNPTAIHLSPTDNWFNVLNGSGLNPGDEVVLSAGVYSHSRRLSFGSFGTAEYPIVVRAAEGANVVITRPNASQNVMDIEGAQYVTFRGLEITGGSAAIRIRRKSGRQPTSLTFEDMVIRNTSDGGFTANETGTTYDGLIFRRNEVTAIGGLAGTVVGTLASTAVVPEPSSIALALVAGCGLLCVRRNR